MAEKKTVKKGSTPKKKAAKKKAEKKQPMKKAVKKTGGKKAAKKTASKKTPQKKSGEDTVGKKDPAKKADQPTPTGEKAEGEKETPPEKKAVKEEPKPEKKRVPKPVEKIKHLPKGVVKGKKDDVEEKRKLEKEIPTFRRADQWRLACIPKSWRKPRGVDSKQHLEKRGKPKLPKIGYKKPKQLSGLHPTGLAPVRITNKKELESIDAATQAAVISSCVGRRSRNTLISFANEKGITILNPRKGEQ